MIPYYERPWRPVCIGCLAVLDEHRTPTAQHEAVTLIQGSAVCRSHAKPYLDVLMRMIKEGTI